MSPILLSKIVHMGAAAFDVPVSCTNFGGYTKALQRILQMHSLPAAPGTRLAYLHTPVGPPEAAIQFGKSHKNARLRATVETMACMICVLL
jgi:hypothetical protein